MRYMMFIKHTEDYENAEVPPSLYEEMGRFIEEMEAAGHFVGGAGLKPPAHGARIRLRGGKLTVLDGPFTETKELIGGYALIDADSDEKARELATRFVEIHRIHWPGYDIECELRPLEEEAQPAE